MGAVAGPADAPPETQGGAKDWIRDWAKRADATLKKANEWVTSGKRAAVERARRVARRVQSGIAAIWKAHPVSKGSDALKALAETASVMSWATIIGSGVATVVLVGAVVWWFTKKG